MPIEKAAPEKAPNQTLFQWDNGTDPVCWEPEYGGTRLLVELFARQPDKYLELYVGKSDHVDYFLDYDHRGHTICCWSLCLSLPQSAISQDLHLVHKMETLLCTNIPENCLLSP